MPRISLGDHGGAVAEIRGILADQGFLRDYVAPTDLVVGGWTVPEAVFDRRLDRATRAFQQQRGLLVDGVVGPATYRALRESTYQLGARTLSYIASAPPSCGSWATTTRAAPSARSCGTRVPTTSAPSTGCRSSTVFAS